MNGGSDPSSGSSSTERDPSIRDDAGADAPPARSRARDADRRDPDAERPAERGAARDRGEALAMWQRFIPAGLTLPGARVSGTTRGAGEGPPPANFSGERPAIAIVAALGEALACRVDEPPTPEGGAFVIEIGGLGVLEGHVAMTGREVHIALRAQRAASREFLQRHRRRIEQQAAAASGTDLHLSIGG